MNDAHALPNGRKLFPVQRWDITLAAIALIGTLLAWYWYTRPRPLPPVPEPPPPPVASRQDLYESQVAPIVSQAEQANREAVARCLERIRELFAGYHRGVDPLTEDLTSVGTRLALLARMPGDWWHNDRRVTRYVEQKFATHLFSEQRLNEDLSKALVALRADFQANRAELLGSVKVALSDNDLAEVVLPDYEAFSREAELAVTSFASAHATDSVYRGVATLVASETAAIAAQQVVVRVAASIGATVATSAAAGGGATAAGTGVGGGAGTSVGPAGTAVGILVGFGVGMVVDWWMTEQCREALANDLRQYLDQLEASIVVGSAGQPGLRETLQDICARMNQTHRAVIQAAVVGGEP